MSVPRWRWLPAEGSRRYHLLLAAAGILVLGPLAGVTAAYMNFSLGVFVGGQVLAGLLGSAVTAGYGASGRHGANYIQTAAASVASMSAMGVLVQAMAWMGMPQPPAWQLVAYFTCIGMFGVGVGMLYTPVLVDRLRLTFPSGLAVANILRALTDPLLLRRSVATLGSGAAAGLVSGLSAERVPWLSALGFSASTFGAGLVVGARIGVAAVVGGVLGWAAQPLFVRIGWLAEGDPFRKITFLIALGAIMGAAMVDLAVIFGDAVPRLRAVPGFRLRGNDEGAEVAIQEPDWQRVHRGRLWAWVVAWATATLATGHLLLGQPWLYLAIAIALVFLFALVNGISVGVSDSNPISSAFVVSVVVMALAGLTDPATGLVAGAILLVSTSVACDMQQDRSTGWRLGTPRVQQFRYQVIGILVGAALAIVFARLFMAAYPVLLQDQTVLREGQQSAQWTSAMTYKFVGVLRSLTDDQPQQRTAILVGIAIGFVIEVLRKRLQPRAFVLDAIVLPSPYALSFGGFLPLAVTLWFGAGGVVGSVLQARAPARADLPPDMSRVSLFGGGLIAGDAIAALAIGMAGLIAATW
ncbi:MAG: OPT/YSL family transporter [Ramlibacter sp.]